MPPKIPAAAGIRAVQAARDAYRQDRQPARVDAAAAVRYLLQELAEQAPGNAVEVRVPPFGATQAIDGPGHTRGTPPNVIETDPRTWVLMATGELSWDQAQRTGLIQASGTRANLAELLPIFAEKSVGRIIEGND